MSNTKMSDVFDLPLTAVGDYVMEEGEAGDYLMDNDGNIYDMEGNFVGTTNGDEEEN